MMHPDIPWMWYDKESVMLAKDDMLELFVRRSQAEITHWDGNTYKPIMSCGTVMSVEKFSYGTFSAEIMLPQGNNLWPSFWLTGAANWPPEIDIMEAWSGDNNYFKWFIAQPPYLSPSWRTTTNVHFLDETMQHGSSGSRNISWFKQTMDPSESFIEYKCVWQPKKITFLTNGKTVRTVAGHECEQLTKNIKEPEKGFEVNVIFNVWCENPSAKYVNMITPMLVKNFKYKPL